MSTDHIDPDDDSLFVPPRSHRLPIFPPKHRHYKQAPPSNLVPSIPVGGTGPSSSFTDALQKNVARLNVDNKSLEPQAFTIFPSKPTLFDNPKLDDLRFGVFQASRYVDKLSEGANGSAMFRLPFNKPLNWANPKASPGILIVAGTESNEVDPKGLRDGTSPPERTDWTLLSSGYTDGHPAKNFCAMTIPIDSEPRFLDSVELNNRGYPPNDGLSPGTVVIRTDDLAGLPSDARAFVGIGAINPRYPREITPVITWVVHPNSRYQIKPDMLTWQLVAGTPQEPGAILDLKLFPNPIQVTYNAPPSRPSNFTLGQDMNFTAS